MAKYSRSRFSRPARFMLVCFLLVAAYLFPFVATRHATGPSDLPPVFAPDFYLYMNIASVDRAAPDLVINPWYKTTLPVTGNAYFKFGGALVALKLVHSVMESWFLATLAWYSLVVLLNCVVGWWVLRLIVGRVSCLALPFLALLLLVDMAGVNHLVSALLHLPNMTGFHALHLPMIRGMYPQTTVPLLLGYLGLQIVALGNRRWAPWIGMAALQFLALVSFPYATLFLAFTTAFVLLFSWVLRTTIDWSRALAFGGICVLTDGIFMLESPAQAAGSSIAAFVPSWHMLLHLAMSKTLVMVVVLVIGVVVLPAEKAHVKCVLLSVGSALSMLLLADCLVNPAFQLTHHEAYFVHAVTVLLIAFIASRLWHRIPSPLDANLARCVLALLMIQGAVTTYFMTAEFLPFNIRNAHFASMLQQAGTQKDDLVLAPGDKTDDFSSAVPLISPAQVLYSRNSEILLTPADTARIQRKRLALYLYLGGHNSSWAEEVLSHPESGAVWQLLQIRDRLLFEGSRDRVAFLHTVGDAFLPVMRQVERRDRDVVESFRPFRRIWLIDDPSAPVFVPSRISEYFERGGEVATDGGNIQWFTARRQTFH